MRNADVYGDKVVFTYAADLFIMDRKDGIATRLTSHAGSEGNARFSPDGTQIAFAASYDGNTDVFVMPAEGGTPRRLTYVSDADVPIDWTPDGKLAYWSTGGALGGFQFSTYIIDPAKPGMPKRLPLEEMAAGSFSPDGNTLVYNRKNSFGFNWRRYRGGTQGKISFYDIKANKYWEIPSKRENSYQPMWVGNMVYYISDRDFGTRNLYSYDTNSKSVKRITEFKDADIKNPQTDGKTIVWERDGFLQAFDIKSSKVENVKAHIQTDHLSVRPRLRNVADSISDMGLSPSGIRIALEARGEIFSVPGKTGDTRNLTNSNGSREQHPRWSPDGKLILFTSDESGEVVIYTRPQMGGEAKMIKTDPKHRITNVEWMPDGKKLTYNTGDGKLYLYDLASSSSVLVAESQYQAAVQYDVAKDGSWIAYTMPSDSGFGAIWLYNVEEKKSTKVTEGYYNDSSVSFDQSGKYIYFVSDRTFIPGFGPFEIGIDMEPGGRVYMAALSKDAKNPIIPKSDEEPVKDDAPPATGGPDDDHGNDVPNGGPLPKGTRIDLEGLAERALPLPVPPGGYGVLGITNGALVFEQGAIWYYGVGGRQLVPMYQGQFGLVTANQSRSKLALQTPQGISIVDARPGIDIASGVVNTSNVEMMWDPKAEWNQIFNEAWRFERDQYYDPNMVGLDWEKIKKQYAAYMPYVEHRADLNYVLGNMISETGTGHSYVNGGEMGPMGTPVNVGYLGADYENDGNYVKFKRVFKGLNFEEGRRSPLGEPGLNVNNGDYLLEINGTKVTADIELHSLLQNKVGKVVNLTVNSSKSMTGSRVIRVRPIANEDDMRYITWVEDNRAKVAKASNGTIGYIHVPNTSQQGIIEFVKGFYSQTNKKAWIIDERFNGGGFIPVFFTDALKRQLKTMGKIRDFKNTSMQTVMDGPKTMLINEFAGSGGDMLPWLFREEKLGPLIGMRTWGGLVGIQGNAPLVDGGGFTAPSFGIYDAVRQEWIAENKGVDPDIEVDARPDLIALGQDPILERGITEMLAQMKKYKYVNQSAPDFIKPKPGQ